MINNNNNVDNINYTCFKRNEENKKQTFFIMRLPFDRDLDWIGNYVSGMGLCLASEVVDNAFRDLSPIGCESDGTSSSANAKPSTASIPPPSRRKRKHSSATGSLEEEHDGSFEVGSEKNHPTNLISLRIAALEALEALLTVVCISLMDHLCQMLG